MIKNIAIGKENNRYYIQTCCNEEHYGQRCDCETIRDNILTEKEAIKIARKIQKIRKVPIVKWY